GRVISRDEDGVTTSEGQGYAMLRAVWSDDADVFERVWTWTQQNLRVRGDHLFAWKWKGGVLDRHSATDADSDIALALVLAARRFQHPTLQAAGVGSRRDLRNPGILPAGGAFFPNAGHWAGKGPLPKPPGGYPPPFAHQGFAEVRPEAPGKALAKPPYAILHW